MPKRKQKKSKKEDSKDKSKKKKRKEPEPEGSDDEGEQVSKKTSGKETKVMSVQLHSIVIAVNFQKAKKQKLPFKRAKTPFLFYTMERTKTLKAEKPGCQLKI